MDTEKQIRKTKIVCTMGPRLIEKGLLRQLILSGMDVARFNFSHDGHEEQLGRYKEVCRLRKELNRPVATMLDTKGPEIRIASFAKGSAELTAGQTFTLTTREVEGDETIVSVKYKELPRDVKPGTRILIDDGLIGMTVETVSDTDIVCTVDNGGVISNNKGVNVPDAHLSMPFISEKDRSDIEFAIDNGFDFIAASFTRCADDIQQIRHIMQEKNCRSLRIIAKIENAEGVKNIDEILRVSDAVMVARGDMGVEIPLEDVPSLQKMIIKKSVQAGKPVITATQMLDSMIKNPRPTRAEATDVANAIYDGTSAIMLSGETSAGIYPIEAVETMARIALRTEADIDYAANFSKRQQTASPDVTSAISHATVTSAHDLKARAIITVTKSGNTARMISRHRPACPIISFTMDPQVWRQLNLSWGVIPMMLGEEHTTSALFEDTVQSAKDAGYLRDGELVVITAGIPLAVSGTTNIMRVHVVGHILCQGTGISGSTITAPLCVADNYESAKDVFKTGDILVCRETTKEMLPLIRKCSGIILESDNAEGHGAISGMSLELPVIIGVSNATDVLKTGAVVTMNPSEGTVSAN